MLKVVDKSRQLPWITGLFGVVVFLLALLPESLLAFVQYDREKILDGELWRMFTGHLVHWNGSHLIWDLLVFVACGGLLDVVCPRSLAKRLSLTCQIGSAPERASANPASE